jgi:hypothetical protein
MNPWDNEPDRAAWTDPDTQLPCLAIRNTLGAWCGYVALPSNHPWTKLGRNDIPVDVHGGLSFKGEREGDAEWIGFDCNHYRDLAPKAFELYKDVLPSYADHATYRTLDYVKTECTNLAKQVVSGDHE